MDPIRNLTALAVLVVGMCAGSAQAQIVNVQALIGDEPEEGFSGSVEAGADYRRGNIDLLLARAAATARYRRGDDIVFAIVKSEYGRTGEPSATFVKKVFEHVRYRHVLTPILTAEAFAQHEGDRFRRLRVRALVGAGPRARIAHGEGWSLHGGAAYMFEHEQLSEDALAEAGERSNAHRLSAYLVGHVEVNEHVTASATFYVQPRLDRASDVRLLGEAALATALSTHLTFKTALVVAHDSEPPPAIEGTDVSVQSTLGAKF
ncbi:MAG: DUF481 domain-containing protein [Deltaproteobacteria bacterium]|nr:DUF481 domain-containing protein [Kofleriaceae bacterium]